MGEPTFIGKFTITFIIIFFIYEVLENTSVLQGNYHNNYMNLSDACLPTPLLRVSKEFQKKR